MFPPNKNKMRILVFLCLFASAYCFDGINVGTVLWKKSDGVKDCWSASEKDLLIARRIMHGLLPEPELVDFTTNHAISTLLDYFRMCFDMIKDGSTGETQEHLLTSLADAVGGYLKRIALPISRQLFYSGRITFEEVNTIHLLYTDLKFFLKTSGQGWKSPELGDKVLIAINALELNTDGDKTACDDLIYKVSLPMLDDKKKPTALAMPLKSTPLVSLLSEESAYLIPKFYTNAVECISAKSKNNIANFNSALYGWLVSEVLPHLDDDVWYIGFGGVLRVLQAIRASGVDVNALEQVNGSISFLFESGLVLNHLNKTSENPLWFKHNFGIKHRSKIEIFAVCFISLSLILALIYFKCLRRRNSSTCSMSSFVERVSSAVTSIRSSSQKSEKSSKISSITNSSKETHTSNSPKYFREIPCSQMINADFLSRLPTNLRSYPTMKHSPHSTSSTDGDAQETESCGTSDSNSESPH